MLAGELYHGWDPELVRERARTRGLLNRYNASGPDDAEGRRAILGALLANIGEGAWVEPPFSCDYGWNISLGERAYLNFGCVLLDCAPIKIGPLTKLGPASTCMQRRTRPTPTSARPGSSTRFRSWSERTPGSAAARSSDPASGSARIP